MDEDIDRRGFLASVAAGTAASATGTAAAQEGEGESGSDGDGGGSSTTHEIEMRPSNVFGTIGLHIQPGDTVRWVNVGGVHNAVSYDGRIPGDAEAFEYSVIQEGESIEHTFETEGTYDYYCQPHRALGMVGRIVVGEPGGPAEESEIPDKPSDGRIPTGEEIVEGGRLSYPFTGLGGGGGGLPFTMLQGGGGFVGGLVITSVAYYFSEKNKGEEGNNALAVGLASLVLGVLLILAVVVHLTTA